MKNSLLTLLFGIGFVLVSQGQATDEEIRAELKKQHQADLEYLASDKLEGRATGEPGEQMAADYIAKRFAAMGLKPAGDNVGFFQPFQFQTPGKLVGENSMKINGQEIALNEGWWPMPLSGSGEASGEIINVGFGIYAPQFDHNDFANIDERDFNGKVVVMQLGLPGGTHPHNKFISVGELHERIDHLKRMEIAGVIFVNNDPNVDNPEKAYPRSIRPVKLPVAFVTQEVGQQLLATPGIQVDFATNIVRETKTGKNVLARIDNGAPFTVVVGAHYDHLGHGEIGSLHRGKPAIHNGADDNASGVAVMLSLAQHYAQGHANQHNYLFIAFSGEEMGLLGSSHFANATETRLSEFTYMINLDMVGRLKKKEMTLGVNGVGTSPSWNKALEKVAAFDMNLKTSPSGIGPSDHSSFYLKEIPAIHIFSGTHKDYHKPSDDVENINYDGMGRITQFLQALIDQLDGEDQLKFTATKNVGSDKAPNFSVTLGVVPDYLFEGEGMRIDGVTDGKPAAEAGIESGDVVVKMGDLQVVDMRSYMTGLSQYKKGDSTSVVVLRNGKEMKLKVQF
ncbi:MAG: M20/M25/M40 family metallo-hydrolase [Salibacteraceae bacterium]